MCRDATNGRPFGVNLTVSSRLTGHANVLLDYDKPPGPLAKTIRGNAALLPTQLAMDAVLGGDIVDQVAKAR